MKENLFIWIQKLIYTSHLRHLPCYLKIVSNIFRQNYFCLENRFKFISPCNMRKALPLRGRNLRVKENKMLLLFSK